MLYCLVCLQSCIVKSHKIILATERLGFLILFARTALAMIIICLMFLMMPGVTAGKAAGMEVVAVPSLPKQSHLYTSADEVINSLPDLHPEKWGLPHFKDWMKDIEPWQIGGPVIKGFGRGSKVLGIPTARTVNMLGVLRTSLGVYFGWAGLPTRGVFKMIMSIGWIPYFNNTEKTVANFPTLESLIEKIHEDRKIAEEALDLPMYSKFKDDPYLKSPT
ncbi:putative riboflavin kinase [Rosa chinensis]|uniref:riboflavin kinase n=1 Tax=Rosa chinensis TaxID=74649 RepID=A0A2P6Q3N4_ROSCH|nr:putative riboflavin kinase [Rosa chinensis]